jgi:putative polyhydroxyalkanoate system protein
MANIKISQAHSLPVEEAKKRINDAFSSVSSKMGLKMSWSGDKLSFSGNGADGTANVTASAVDVEVKLGMMASAFKGKIESGLKEQLEKGLKA